MGSGHAATLSVVRVSGRAQAELREGEAGIRWFFSSLPPDLGLRASFGRSRALGPVSGREHRCSGG